MLRLIQLSIIVTVLSYSLIFYIFNLKKLFFFIVFTTICFKILLKLPNKLRTTIFIIGIVFLCVVFLPLGIIRQKRDSTNLFIPLWFVKQFGELLGITVELRGLNNIGPETGNIFIMNHQSWFDVLPIATLCHLIGKITIISKEEMLYLPFFGMGLWLSGSHFVNRKNRTESINTLNTEVKSITMNNNKLFIFPEGTRNTKDELLPFKKGAFHVALQANCPIQPIVVSYCSFLYDNKKVSHILVKILPLINIKNFDNAKILAEHCKCLMQNELNILNNEINKISEMNV